MKRSTSNCQEEFASRSSPCIDDLVLSPLSLIFVVLIALSLFVLISILWQKKACQGGAATRLRNLTPAALNACYNYQIPEHAVPSPATACKCNTLL